MPVAGELEDVYDEATVAALDRAVRTPRPVPAVVVGGWRGRLGAGAIATAAMVGVGEALDPSRNALHGMLLLASFWSLTKFVGR